MIKRVFVLLAMLCPLTVVAPAFADVPSLLPIQGYLTDKQNLAIDGSKSVSFRLYTTATGGTALHDETLPLVIAKGYFTAYLGDDSTNPLDFKTLRDSPRVFLGIEVGSDGEAVPRLQLASTAFAAQASYCTDATNLGGKAPTAYAAAMHTHDWSEITGKPTTFPPTPTDPMCYANLTAAGYLDGNGATDLTTQAQGDARYATKSHTHDGADIQSGTISDARYSAYADLGVEGYLDANTGTDLLTVAQGDARYVSPGEANSVTSSMIVDGTIAAADLAANSVTMDKTTAPIGAAYANAPSAAAGGQYVFASPAVAMDTAGTCLYTATAKLS
ncbi:MAG TPA: hypothetical protein VHZ95_14005, partial [Polyangiales bacterium]|nr:hypothetical protein [Polyangiales bacterium]